MSANKGGKGYRGPPKPRGSFLNGVWHCECAPPLPAIHYPVKKAGPNKGRWCMIIPQKMTRHETDLLTHAQSELARKSRPTTRAVNSSYGTLMPLHERSLPWLATHVQSLVVQISRHPLERDRRKLLPLRCPRPIRALSLIPPGSGPDQTITVTTMSLISETKARRSTKN